MSLENLASKLPEEDQKRLAAQVVGDFEGDDDSRKGWLEMHADWLRVYNQHDKPKNPPWPGASDETMPLLVEGCTQYSARAFTALFPNKGNIVSCVPTLKMDPITEARAKRVGKHMSWQLTTKDRLYKQNKDRLLQGQPLHGSYFTKSYYDPRLQRNATENVRPEDLVIPYGIGPRDIDTIERKTQILYLTVNETAIRAATGFFLVPCQPFDFGNKTPTQAVVDKREGITESLRDRPEKGLCCILEQHCVWDLDNDGIAEPYIAWVDRQSHKLLRLVARYDQDPTQPDEYFTHYPYMANPEGFYGLGLGHLIAPINRAVNKLLRQGIDANTLANIGNASGFISSQLAVRGGDQQMVMGVLKKIDMPADDISRGIFTFKFPGPSAATLQFMQALIMRSDRLASVTELTTGQPDKVYQPTMAMALIEQAQQVYTSVYQRTINSWTSELQKLYALNSKFMQDVEQFAVFNADGSVDREVATKDDYAPDLMVMPIADPSNSSKEARLKKAEVEYQTILTNPLTAQNPISLYFATHRFLESIEVQNIDQVLPPPTPPREDDPHMENKAALMPMPTVPPAFPDQDHMTHIAVHKQLADGQDPASSFLTPQGAQALQGHIQMHVAELYGQAHGGTSAEVPGGNGADMAAGLAGGILNGGAGGVQGTA